MAQSAGTKDKNSDPSVADLAAQIDTLKADITGLSQLMADYGKARGADVAESAKHQLEYARAQGEAGLERVASHASEISHQADTYVKNNPAAALGIAAGIGFLVGLLNGRK